MSEQTEIEAALRDDSEFRDEVANAIRPSVGWQGAQGDLNAWVAAGRVLDLVDRRLAALHPERSP